MPRLFIVKMECLMFFICLYIISELEKVTMVPHIVCEKRFGLKFGGLFLVL